jgi:organic radical activating enzyme
MEGCGVKNTMSLCPQCFEEIPATIGIDETVVMSKICPEHGIFTSLVETDPHFYRYINLLPNGSIYDGLLVDITGKCNLSCAVCLHADKSGHLAASTIVEYCRSNADLGPFFLSGGEPTTHPELFAIIEQLKHWGGVGVITNGIKLTNAGYLQELCNAFGGDVVPVALSIHPEAQIGQRVVDNFRAIGKKLSAVFWVITSMEEIHTAMEFYQSNSDVICQLRIKAATNVWGTQHVADKIFVSDILAELHKIGTVQIDTSKGNKTTAVNCLINDLPVMAVSWYDKHNIDLCDIDCPPYYKGKDGVIRDFLSASILNERFM